MIALFEFLVKNTVVLALVCTCSDHVPRVGSILLFTKVPKNGIAMLTTKKSFAGSVTTTLDFFLKVQLC